MKVIALQMFNDLKADTLRNEGDIFEVDPDRYAEIMAKRTDLVQPYEAPEDKATGEGGEAPEDKATGEGADSVKKPASKSTRKTSKGRSAK
ncbi:hypothetical protein [Adlercreutzia sp.]|uniref:hypothetical protein n=1 Tax=Adlercreutzia sp. TaxID=1872387 RepID=UPI003AEFF7B8